MHIKLRINPHIGYPIALGVLAVVTPYVYHHDAGIVVGMFEILKDVLRVMLTWEPGHHRQTFPYVPTRDSIDWLVYLPHDWLAVGYLAVLVGMSYWPHLELAWARRKLSRHLMTFIEEPDR